MNLIILIILTLLIINLLGPFIIYALVMMASALFNLLVFITDLVFTDETTSKEEIKAQSKP